MDERSSVLKTRHPIQAVGTMDENNAAFRALAKYVNAAADMAECIKLDIQKRGYISEKTIKALNKFAVASNDVASLIEDLEHINTKLN